MNALEIEKAVNELPHIEALAVALWAAHADAGCGRWPRPTVTAEAAAKHTQALQAYRTAVHKATAELQAVVQSINRALAVPGVERAA